jgi:hypothetical protein
MISDDDEYYNKETTNKQNAIVEVEGTGRKGQDRMVNRSKSKLHVITRTLQNGGWHHLFSSDLQDSPSGHL